MGGGGGVGQRGLSQGGGGGEGKGPLFPRGVGTPPTLGAGGTATKKTRGQSGFRVWRGGGGGGGGAAEGDRGGRGPPGGNLVPPKGGGGGGRVPGQKNFVFFSNSGCWGEPRAGGGGGKGRGPSKIIFFFRFYFFSIRQGGLFGPGRGGGAYGGAKKNLGPKNRRGRPPGGKSPGTGIGRQLSPWGGRGGGAGPGKQPLSERPAVSTKGKNKKTFFSFGLVGEGEKNPKYKKKKGGGGGPGFYCPSYRGFEKGGGGLSQTALKKKNPEKNPLVHKHKHRGGISPQHKTNNFQQLNYLSRAKKGAQPGGGGGKPKKLGPMFKKGGGPGGGGGGGKPRGETFFGLGPGPQKFSFFSFT